MTEAERLHARAAHAKQVLEDEIEHSSATTPQKAFMRQKLAHLWTLIRPKTEETR